MQRTGRIPHLSILVSAFPYAETLLFCQGALHKLAGHRSWSSCPSPRQSATTKTSVWRIRVIFTFLPGLIRSLGGRQRRKRTCWLHSGSHRTPPAGVSVLMTNAMRFASRERAPRSPFPNAQRKSPPSIEGNLFRVPTECITCSATTYTSTSSFYRSPPRPPSLLHHEVLRHPRLSDGSRRHGCQSRSRADRMLFFYRGNTCMLYHLATGCL